MLFTQKDFIKKMKQIDLKFADYDEKIMLIFEYLKQLEQAKHQEDELRERRRIGFKSWSSGDP